MIYADYQFYKSQYMTAEKEIFKSEIDFLQFSRNAAQYINLYTFGSVPDEVPEDVKMCCCELAEFLFNADSSKNINIKSEKVGDYSVEYEIASDKEKAFNLSIRNIIYKWLAKTGLLYCGVI